MRLLLFLSCLIFTANLLWAQPANDNWQDALDIPLSIKAQKGVDTIYSKYISFQKATIETNETFSPIIRTLALDQKSVWYKFDVKKTLKLEVKLIQKDSFIQATDIGMTIYKGNGSYPNYKFGKNNTIAIMGSYTSLFSPGTYYIQTVARKNVTDSIAVRINSYALDVYGNSIQNPHIVSSNNEINFLAVDLDSLAEKKPFQIDSIQKSAYAAFTTKAKFDRIKISAQVQNMAAVLYKVGAGENPNNWDVIKLLPFGSGDFEWQFICNQIEPSTQYMFKFLGSYTGKFIDFKVQYLGNGNTSGTDPIENIKKIELDFEEGMYKAVFTENFKCQNQNALKICNDYKYLLNDTVKLPFLNKNKYPQAYDTVLVPTFNTGGWWLALIVSKTMIVNNISENVLVFKGRTKANICELGKPVSLIDKCLFPGEEYTFLLHKSPNLYTINDTLKNGSIGTSFNLQLEYTVINNEWKKGFFYKKEYAQYLGEIMPSDNSESTKYPIQKDWVEGYYDEYVFGKDSMNGSFSFVELELLDSAYISYLSNRQEDSGFVSFLNKPNIYKLDDSGLNAKAIRYNNKKCPPAKYLLVFNVPNSSQSACADRRNYMIAGKVIIRKKQSESKEEERCAHNHYAAKIAYQVNDLNGLSYDYVNENKKETGRYLLSELCTKESFSTLNKPLLFNYNKYKKKIPGFVYYVFKLDEQATVEINFNTSFQLIKGNISQDSSIASKNNILLEFGEFYRGCDLEKGFYSIIAIENNAYVKGDIKISKTGYSLNDHFKLAQDLGVLNSDNPSAIMKGVFGCKTTYLQQANSSNKDTWHTFQLNQPGNFILPFGTSFTVYKQVENGDLTFNDLINSNLLDSQLNNLTTVEGIVVANGISYTNNSLKTERFFVQVTYLGQDYWEYNEKIEFFFDTQITQKGDSCTNAISVQLTAIDSAVVNANCKAHTLGEGPYETAQSNFLISDIAKYKTTWLKVNIQNASGLRMQIQPNNSIHSYRLYYGSCTSLTPAAVVNSDIDFTSSMAIDCIDNGEYFIQVFKPQDPNSEDVNFNINTKKKEGFCQVMDLEKVLANFSINGGCPNTVVTFTNLSTLGNDMQYFWDFGDGNIDTVVNPIHQYPLTNSLDTFYARLIAKNRITNRTDTIIKEVVVGALDVAIISDTFACEQNTLSIEPKGYNYLWYHKKYKTKEKIYLGNKQSINLDFNQVRQYIYVDISIGNCSLTDSIMFRHYLGIDQKQTLCLSNKPIKLYEEIVATNLQLKQNDGTAFDSMLITQAGTYNFLVYLNDKLCFSNYEINVEEIKKPNLIDDPICEGSAVVDELNSNEWELYKYDPIFNSLMNYTRNHEVYLFAYRNKNSYCGMLYDTIIAKNMILKPSIMNDSLLCNSDVFEIDLTDSSFSNVLWDNGSTLKERNLQSDGLYYLSYNYKGCSFADTAVITTATGKELNLNDQVLCFQDEEANLNITDFDSLYWSNGSNDTEQIFSNEGTYWLQAFKNGCAVSDTFTLTNYCEPKLFIPNAFSPNGDAENPVFIAKGDKIQKFQIRIYNRDGALIFYTDNINEGWDGRIKNLDAPMASYFYVVEYSTEQGDFVKSGNLLLLR